jgi:Ni,Fe-hydrogenase maturation factor
MTIYVFGNPDHPQDSLTLIAADRLKKDFPEIDFHPIAPGDDLPLPDKSRLIIMDVIQGIRQPTILTDSQLNKLSLSPRTSTHDYDLGFQLKYLKKLKKLKTLTIIALPPIRPIDYPSLHSIFKKLVAQDIHGS